MSWLTPEYRAAAERHAPRFAALSGVCLLMVLLAWLGTMLRGLERAQHPNALKDALEAYLRSGQHQLVDWHACSVEAFRLAQRRDRLILIEVGAYWSGRCQRIGREVFSDSGVADLVNREFVAVKVDAEAMPKLARYVRQLAQLMNAPDRYPMVAWFTPEGKPIRAVAPDTRAELMRHLEELSQLYRNRSEQIQQQAESLERAWNARWARAARPTSPDAEAAIQRFLRALAAQTVTSEQGMPVYNLNHLEALLALAEQGNAQAREMLLPQLHALHQSPYWDAAQRTVHALADGVDPEGKPTGGKRLVEHARLLSLYSRASRIDPELGSVAHELADSLRSQFYRERPVGFIGALPPPKLRIAIAQSLGVPFVDKTVYADANAYAVLALVDYAETFGLNDPRTAWARAAASRVLQTLHALRTPRGDLFHSSLRQTSDWLTDIALTVRAATRVHQIAPDPRTLRFAQQLLQFAWREHADPTGGFYDIARSQAWESFRAIPVRASVDEALPADNALLALAAYEYALASGEPIWRERAAQLTQVLAGDYNPDEPLQHAGYIQLLAKLPTRR